ncbi:MAG: FAD-dependent oxidoreductase [Clostridia bacterium]|nr:FAD-dependent oxidoreductase [Clostridia bacterium]
MDSFWTKSVTLPSFPAMKHDIRADVLIIGGGLTGLLCAYQLQRAGLDVVVVEANTIGSGVTGRTTAKITTQHGACYHIVAKRYGMHVARQYYEANREALEAYNAIEGDLDLKTCDGVLFSRTHREVLEIERNVLCAIGAKVEWTDAAELPFSVAGALRIPHQVQVHPLKLLNAVIPTLKIYEHTRVREIRGNIVTTDNGTTVTAESIIVATHFPFLNRHGAYFLKLYQHRAYALAVANTPPLERMYWEEKDNGLTFRQCGDHLLVVGGGHRTGKPGLGWKAAEQVVRHYYPDARITARFATQDCMSLDGIPYIGRYAKHSPQLYVATGFNGWGMTSSMTAALLLTGELIGKPKPWTSVFAPDRTIWHRQLATNVGETLKTMVTPTVPRCPHLGCALKWNAAERSWDCPCHGSRFSENGKLRNGPATGDLKKG